MDIITYYSSFEYEIDESIAALEGYGVPRSKIAWGLPIGCDGPAVQVPVTEAVRVANIVKNGGYAGVTTWSMNRDTDHRTDAGVGCTDYQTGQPDGTFLREIGAVLK